MTADHGSDWSAAPLGPGVRILRVDASGLAALDKPAGVLSHPNKPGEESRSLLAARYDEGEQCYAWADATGRERRAWLLHRLDSATSGIVLVASRRETAMAVREAFEQRSVHKRYLAVVLGHPRERRAHWRDAMEVSQSGGRVRAAGGGALRAEATMHCLRLVPGPPALSVLELEPLTGRTHQLRHQCARRHLPILGDQNYGDFKRNRELARRFGTDRLFLHAKDVRLQISVAGKKLSFAAQSPLPPEFGVFVGR